MNSTLELTTFLISCAYLSFVGLLIYIVRLYFKSKTSFNESRQQSLQRLVTSKKYHELVQRYADIQAIKQRNHKEYTRQMHAWRSEAIHLGTRQNLELVSLIENTYKQSRQQND